MRETRHVRHPSRRHSAILGPCSDRRDTPPGSHDDEAGSREQAHHTICSFGEGAVVFDTGQDADAVYYVLSGAILLCRPDKVGKAQILEALGERAFVGVTTGTQYDCRAVAMTRTIAARLSYAQVRDSARIQSLITEQLTHSLARMRDRAACYGHKAAPRLVANTLLSLPKCLNPRLLGRGSHRTWDVRIMMTEVELANCLNLTQQTVRRVLANLKADGIVSMLTPRLLAIRDQETLRRLEQGEKMQAHPQCYYHETSTRKKRAPSEP